MHQVLLTVKSIVPELL